MSQAPDVILANARLAIGSSGDAIGPISSHGPAFELFHAAKSICSQKVRVVLLHHDFGFLSHSMNLFEGQTYLPDYVRLRMLGCDALGGDLAAHHSGSTSTSRGGCDGAVVPTLVDRATGEVIVDSKRICIYLDNLAPEPKRLRPAPFSGAIDEEIEIIDNLPNYQMLMGRKVAAEDASSRAMTGASFSERKVAWCDQYLLQNAGDETLRRAYEAKRAKELSAATDLFSEDAMRDAYARVESAVRGLEQRLAIHDGAWLFGNAVTMADLFWGIELLRTANVGAGGIWENGQLPRVDAFVKRAEGLPSIRSAIIDWPGAVY